MNDENGAPIPLFKLPAHLRTTDAEIPEGFRELKRGEIILGSDQVRSGSVWVPRSDGIASTNYAIGHRYLCRPDGTPAMNEAYHFRTIRKISG